ncbi:putative L-allo-threonine aldolase-like isoform 1 [Capsicum annuum]|nr:putative L-allo-threonine aldolase-like isoform 1 [Capsicum annuum]KAF3663285.1 putative L-allo-threonine aldolase-like isoform 1 [Capsicum annuum]
MKVSCDGSFLALVWKMDPPGEDISASDLSWTKFKNEENHDDIVLVPYDRVDAFIIGQCCNVEFPTRRHVNKSSSVCHGPLNRDAIGPGTKKIPYIYNEIQQQTMSMIYLGIPEENVLAKHIEGIKCYYSSDAKVNNLASQYVHKLGMIIKRSTHELDLDDQASITLWHRSLIADDSTFGIKKLKCPLCTLLVFDSRHHALPVSWITTCIIAKPDMIKWMKPLHDHVHAVDLT